MQQLHQKATPNAKVGVKQELTTAFENDDARRVWENGHEAAFRMAY